MGMDYEFAETRFGKIGALICGENTNPLARYSLMAQGEQVHISTWPAVWPAVWPTSVPSSVQDGVTEGATGGGSNAEKRTNYDNVSANRTRAAAHRFENMCFGVLCTGYLDASNIEAVSFTSSDPKYVPKALEGSSRGATMFLDPTGASLPGYTVDLSTGAKVEQDFLQMEEGILYAQLDSEKCVEGRQYHNVVGGYQRLDIFDFKANRTRREPATFID
jgi:nitrilase